jgi:ankyrin repeat protein
MPPKKKGGKKKTKKSSGPSAAEAKEAVTISLPTIPTAKTLNLMNAVGVGNTKVLTRMVYHYDHGKELQQKDANGSTPLHMAAIKGDADTVERLLSFSGDFPIDVNALEISKVGGYAPIHHACAGGHVRILEQLLKAGANPNLQTNSTLGETPLHICVKRGEHTLGCAKTLLQAGARSKAVDKFGNNASWWAYSNGNSQMARELDLPQGAGASADDYIQLMMNRIPGYKMPTGEKKKKGGGGKKKK